MRQGRRIRRITVKPGEPKRVGDRIVTVSPRGKKDRKFRVTVETPIDPPPPEKQ